MVKIKFIGTDMTSNGITYTNNGVYEVSQEVADYLDKNFKNIEVISKSSEEKPKVEVEEKLKVGAKVVPTK